MHPAGLMIVPQDMDVHDFTPLQHPADQMDTEDVATHFDYHDISGAFSKIDVLAHDIPSMIKMLQDMTHCDPTTIPFDDSATLSLFRSTEALGVSPEELGTTTGTLGIPEFRTSFARRMIDETHPTCFSDLVKISAFSHGTDVWLNNAEDLIRDGVCTIRDAISTRDDIFMYLVRKGLDRKLSYEVMESVRKGKGIKDDLAKTLKACGVPEWYIEACQKIGYLFPRAHAAAYVMMSFRIAYYKVHYPQAFYTACFSLHAKMLDVDTLDAITTDKGAVQTRLKELEAVEHPDDKQREAIIVLQLAREMSLRGYSAEIVDCHHV